MTTKNIREEWTEFLNKRMKVEDEKFGVALDLEKDVSDWWLDKMKAQIQEDIEWAEKQKIDNWVDIGKMRNAGEDGYNKALDDTIAHLREKLKRIK